MVEFRFNIAPGAEEEAAQERALARKQLGEDLKLAVEQLRAAKAAKDAEAVRRLEAQVLPSLMVRTRVYGVDELPSDLKTAIKVEKVTWEGEPALRHLEALGFKRPSSPKKLQQRVQFFVRNLVLGGKGDLLPEDLIHMRLRYFVGVFGS